MEYNDKQVQIMETAEILFAEKGFNGTSVRDIAEKAHVNLAMISYYFGSKDKLLESLFDYRGEHVKLKLESMVEDKTLGSFEKLDLLIDHYIEKIMDAFLYIGLLFLVCIPFVLFVRGKRNKQVKMEMH